jgi:hypothetical protein
MATSQKLTSLCIHCGKRVDFGRLAPYPEGHPRFKGQYRRGEDWHHFRRPAGDEILCDPTGTNAELFQKKATPKSFCTESVGGRDAWTAPRTCNKRKRELVDGIPMCGVHATRLKNERAKDAVRRQKIEISNYVMTETLALAADLESKFGIDAKMHFDHKTFEYTGLVLVNPRHLMDFLDEIFG